MDESATLKEILANPRKFKVCAKCGKILLRKHDMCDCGHSKFKVNALYVIGAAEIEIGSLARIYGYSREDALETEQDV